MMYVEAKTERYESGTAPPDEAALGQLLEEFLAALEAGEPIDREAWLSRFPQGSEELATMLEQLEALHHMAGNTTGGESEILRQQNVPPSTLGDYRIVREVGRGGMGVVYEAEQISLARRVALKVLPFAAMLDERQLTRFKNEARAAATLDHPHIVAVHAVGCERSVHFYAMQFIEGYSLAQMIVAQRAQHRMQATHQATATGEFGSRDVTDGSPNSEFGEPKWGLGSTDPTCACPTSELPVPTLSPVANHQSLSTTHQSAPPFDTVATDALATILSDQKTNPATHYRTVARLGIQAAEALQHAHERGVVHRDIKPANLMLDKAGKLWVTDFGLARLEADAGMTMTGDVIGTLRYMSPEQAQGKPAVVDHRTDIYSLGATLYELVALQPAFGGDDRQSLIQQILDDEPSRLKAHVDHVPRELETIILKSMAKIPAERYAAAQELADDLQRFLEHKPILARRPSLVDRAAKWSRRHRGPVAAATTLLLLGTIGSSIAAFQINESLAAETVERQRADDNLDLANANLKKAQANLDIALDALNEVHLHFVYDVLPKQREISPADQRIVESILTHYEALAAANEETEAFQDRLMDAYGKIFDARRALGVAIRPEAYERIARILEKRSAARPNDVTLKIELSALLNLYARELDVADRIEESCAVNARAISIREALLEAQPTDNDRIESLAISYHNQGMAIAQTGAIEKAVSLFSRSADLMRPLVARNPRGYDANSVNRRVDLAIILWELGRRSKKEDAAKHWEEGLEVLGPLDEWKREIPHSAGARHDAKPFSNRPGINADGTDTVQALWIGTGLRFELARLRANKNQAKDVEPLYLEVLELAEQLNREPLHRAKYFRDFTIFFEEIGRFYEQKFSPPRLEDAIACYRRDLEIHDDFLIRHAYDEARQGIPTCRSRDRLVDIRNQPAATEALREHAERWTLAAGREPTNLVLRESGRRALGDLAIHIERQNGPPSEAEAAWRKANEYAEAISRNFQDNVEAKWTIAHRYMHLAGFYRRLNRPDEAGAALNKSAAMFDGLLSSHGSKKPPTWLQVSRIFAAATELLESGKSREATSYYEWATENGGRLLGQSPYSHEDGSTRLLIRTLDQLVKEKEWNQLKQQTLDGYVTLIELFVQQGQIPKACEALRKRWEVSLKTAHEIPALPTSHVMKIVDSSPELRRELIGLYRARYDALRAKHRPSSDATELLQWSRLCRTFHLMLVQSPHAS